MAADISKFTYFLGTALDRFISENQKQFTYASGELSQLLRDISLASKIINREISKAGLTGIAGSMGEDNIQGEHQKMLDVISEFRFIATLRRGRQTCGIISEEQAGIIDTGNHNAKYVVAIDPMDGSSNIDVNVSIGTIFSIYRRISPLGTPATEQDFLQVGANLVAAGYILYGPSNMLVFSTGFGVNGFTYDPTLGEYFLSHPNMKFASKGEIYSINEGSYHSFSPQLQYYLELCKKRKYSARYIGSLVADFHRNLLKGGIYIYPSTKSHPNGKLRLLYECNALAFIAEQAGGKATDGKKRILDIQPYELHQRTPFFVGSAEMVDEVMEILERKM
ncbi:MAG: class 1 fructose-bisphosphatase [Cytophagales bacterium]|nr:class 1 fructose-bisphosphatase [Cytophagales bacterium]MDW8384041.1 class 1 fructose-bisphosphatase [Flammeovirgaceae bacterium]